MSKEGLYDFCTSLVKDHSAELYRFAYRWSGNTTAAEDLVSEAFAEAWKSIAGLKNQKAARAWLFQILRRCCYRWTEAKKRQPSLVEMQEEMIVSNRDEQERYELRDSLNFAIQKLDESFREAFLMVVVEGLSCRQAAESLKIPLGTLLSRVHRAKKTLRSALGRNDLENLDDSKIIRLGAKA